MAVETAEAERDAAATATYLLTHKTAEDYTAATERALADRDVDLAASIAQEPGLIWKIWTENAATNEAGGIYLFADRPSAEAYLAMHTARLKGFGIPEVNGKIFDVNGELSAIDRAPL